MGEIRNRVNEIDVEIKELIEEKKFLQKTCKHEDYKIGTYSYRVGVYDPAKICTECDRHLGTPSLAEMRRYEESQSNKEKET